MLSDSKFLSAGIILEISSSKSSCRAKNIKMGTITTVIAPINDFLLNKFVSRKYVPFKFLNF